MGLLLILGELHHASYDSRRLCLCAVAYLATGTSQIAGSRKLSEIMFIIA